jgi:hypothetical protein
MRATTIIDWDHKELIVPNKTFITNQLVNWTLTDPVTRIVIQLGISYGSDIDLANLYFLLPQRFEQTHMNIMRYWQTTGKFTDKNSD